MTITSGDIFWDAIKSLFPLFLNNIYNATSVSEKITVQ